MNTRTVASLVACSFLLLLVQLVSLLVGPVTGLVCGAAVGALSALLLKFFQIELAAWAGVVLPTASSAVSVAIVYFSRNNQPAYIWLACALALGVSLTIEGVKQGSSKRCALCNRRLSGRVSFACPRCGLTVCDSCWVFEASRCRLCEQNRVPIFPPDARWWDRQLGPRTEHGRCQLCQVPAQDADLRACRKCGRPHCRDCWDSANGQCSRCQWTMEELPESLRPYVLTAEATGREVRRPSRAR